jgi:DNA-binding Lrp family transcriptional regulator
MLGMSDLLPLPPSLDLTDRKILYELELDSRQSLGKLAKKVRTSKQTLHYRIQRLVKDGVIIGFITAIDLAKLGYVDYEVWIQLRELSLEKRKDFLDHMNKHPNIRWVASCGGKYDVALAILAKNLTEFISVFKGIARRFPGYMKEYIISMVYEFHRYPRSHLLKKPPEREELYSWGEQKKVELEPADLQIISLLAKNSRMPTLDLAKETGLSPNTIRSKIKKMEDLGIIKAYTTSMHSRKIGYRGIDLLVSLHNMSEEKDKELESYCLQNKNIGYMLKVVGKWDLYISFDEYTRIQFQEFLVEFRSKFAELIKDFDYMTVFEDHKFDYYPLGR